MWLYTQNALSTTNSVTSSCLVASLVHFTPSDLDLKWMSRKKGY